MGLGSVALGLGRGGGGADSLHAYFQQGMAVAAASLAQACFGHGELRASGGSQVSWVAEARAEGSGRHAVGGGRESLRTPPRKGSMSVGNVSSAERIIIL